MSATATSATVQRVRNPFFQETDRRGAERHACALEATSHAIEPGPTLSWGAVVNDISVGGVSITLCYPFRLGTYLAVDLPCASGMVRTLMIRVVHVDDLVDGMWRLGCEFLKPLTQSDMDLIV
jgi:PilZ domain